MIKFDLLVCAEKLLKDSDKDSYSAINILEDYIVETLPIVIPRLAVLLVSSKDNEDPQEFPNAVFSVLNNSEIVFSTKFSIKFSDKRKSNTAFNVSNIIIKNSGKLTFEFTHETQSIGCTLNVKLREKPTTTSAST